MADMVLLNGRIFTVNAAQPWAQAVAIRDGKFVAVGKDEEIKRLVGRETEVIDLRGKLALPGFNDAHLHFTNGGLYLLGIDLRPARDEKEFARILKEYIYKMPKGEWVTGGNWDHENWPSKKHPRREMIDPFTRRSPGACLAPRRPHGAGQLAGPEAGRDHPRHARPAGRRDRQGQENRRAHRHPARQCHGPGQQGHPAAVAREARAGHPRRHAPRPGAGRDQRPGQQLAPRTWRSTRSWRRKGELGVRINAWRGADGWADFQRIGITAPFGDPFLRLGTVKLFVDGSMGAGTALFFEPYADDPSTSGLPIHTQAELEALVGERRRGRAADRGPRHRRQGQRLDPRSVRQGPRRRRRPRLPPPRRARPGGARRRRGPLQGAGRHRLDPALALHRRHALGREAHRRQGERRLSFRLVPGRRRAPGLRHRLGRRAPRPAPGAVRRGQPRIARRAARPAAGTRKKSSSWHRPSKPIRWARRMPNSRKR